MVRISRLWFGYATLPKVMEYTFWPTDEFHNDKNDWSITVTLKPNSSDHPQVLFHRRSNRSHEARNRTRRHFHDNRKQLIGRRHAKPTRDFIGKFRQKETLKWLGRNGFHSVKASSTCLGGRLLNLHAGWTLIRQSKFCLVLESRYFVIYVAFPVVSGYVVAAH